MDPTVQVALLGLVVPVVATPVGVVLKVLWNKVMEAHAAQLADRERQIKESKESLDDQRERVQPLLKSVQNSQGRVVSLVEAALKAKD